MKCNVVWLKRDLRLHDHAPLAAAQEAGLPLLLLFCFEPSLIHAPMYDLRHWRFVYQSLQDLKAQLQPYRGELLVVHGEVLEVLEQPIEVHPIHQIFAHQETGVKLTFDRDTELKGFCKRRGIHLREFPQDGVDRGLTHRWGWDKRWEAFMNSDLPTVDLAACNWLNLKESVMKQLMGPPLPKGFTTEGPEGIQPGGERYAWAYLKSFVHDRGRYYTPHISKPEGARFHGSRLSPFLAYGNISARQVHQYIQGYKGQVPYQQMLDHFHERLWWRSHYMQKLESDYRIEWENLNRGFDGAPKNENPDVFEAWSTGNTGYPMIDASMRCLLKTGFMNFRMRAMLATFWAFTLNRSWQEGAMYTARLFLDFEPGIHYPQWQMQAGMSGYHPLRIYNPTTQFQRHDPEGKFVKKWVPELNQVPVPLVYEPWKMTLLEQGFYHCRIGYEYPAPLVHLEGAHQEAKEAYWNMRKSPSVQERLPEIWLRHCLPQNVEKYQA